MAQLINQFAQAPVQGQLDLAMNTDTMSVQIDASSAGSLVPGQAVKWVDTANGLPLVVEAATDVEQIAGFINYNIKDATFAASQAVEISAFNGNVMYMTASAAIAVGASVMVVIASKKIATATSGKRIIGVCLDKATADGDLVRVRILLPGALA